MKRFNTFRFSLICLLPAILLSACDGLVTEQLPDHDPKMVLNAFLENGRPIDIYLSRSYGLLERIDSASQIMIEDATVELLIDGQMVGELVYKDTLLDLFSPFGGGFGRIGKYVAEGYTGQSGSLYTVRASSTGYDPIEASTTLPFPANIVDIKIEQNVARTQEPLGGGSQSQSMLKVTLEDKANVENYYSFELFISYFDNNQQQLIQTPVFVEGLAKPADNGGFAADETIISDKEFDGQTTTLDLLIHLPNSWMEQSAIRPLEIEYILLTTTSSNSDYARYQIQRDKQGFSGGGFDFFPSESVVVHDNVEGGYGILGGLVVSRDSFPQ